MLVTGETTVTNVVPRLVVSMERAKNLTNVFATLDGLVPSVALVSMKRINYPTMYFK